MRVKGKRVLKNGVTAGYVRQEDGSWRWRFLSGPKKSRKRGGVGEHNEEQNRKTLKNAIAASKEYEAKRAINNWEYRSRHGINLFSGLPITNQNRGINRIRGLELSKKRAEEAKKLILASKKASANAPANARGNNQRANARRNNQQQTETIPQASIINKMTIPDSFVTDKNISNHQTRRGFFGSFFNSYAGSNLPNKQHDLHGEDFLYTIDNLKRIRTDINKDSRHLKKKGDLRAMNDLLNTSISKRYFIYFEAFLNSLPDEIKFAEGFLRIPPNEITLNYFKEKINGELLEPHVIIDEVLGLEHLPNKVSLYGSILKYLLSESVLNNPGHNIAQFKNVSERITGNMTIAQNEHYKLGIEIRFFINIMRKLIIPILENTARRGNQKTIEINGISRLLAQSFLPEEVNVETGQITIGNVTGPQNIIIQNIIIQRDDLVKQIIERCLESNVPDSCLVREPRIANVPLNTNMQPNGQGVARGGSRKRRKRKSTKKKRK